VKISVKKCRRAQAFSRKDDAAEDPIPTRRNGVRTAAAPNAGLTGPR